MSNDVLLFTYADRKYDFFAVPYAYFALKNNPTAKVEVCLEDEKSFLEKHEDSVSILEEIFPGRAKFRQSAIVLKEPNIIPNTVRFVETPITKCEHVYIGDIDLLVLDDILRIHLRLIYDNSLPFSNVLRLAHADSARPRLSGLHFCRFDLYYPLPDLSDLDFSQVNDENVLYEVMKRKGAMVPKSFQERPECGIHMSLNRDPTGRTRNVGNAYSTQAAPSWAGKQYHKQLLNEIKEETFSKLYPHLDMHFRFILLVAESLAAEQYRAMHRLACSYMVDKRLVISQAAFSMSDLYAERDVQLQSENFLAAERTGMIATIVWPQNPSVWIKQAWLWLRVDKAYLAVEALNHILDLPGGKELLSEHDICKKYAKQIRAAGMEGETLMKRISET